MVCYLLPFLIEIYGFDENHDNDTNSGLVITCFPQRRECGLDDPDRYMTDVLENIVRDIGSRGLRSRDSPTTPEELSQLIINECIRTFFDPMKNLEDDFKFLDMFSNSISRMVSALAGQDVLLN